MCITLTSYIEGSIINFTDRVHLALIALEPRYTKWPGTEERKAMEEKFTEEGIPGGCVGAIDGCHIVLFACPGTHDYVDYFNRKERYSYNIQAVVDINKVIRHLHVGHPGCSHDMRVFSESQVGEDPASLLDPHQYIIADSGYKPLYHIVPVFKKEPGQTTVRGDEVRLNCSNSSLIS